MVQMYDKNFEKRQLEEIVDNLNDKSIVLYGASTRNKSVIDRLGQRIRCVIDKEIDKAGKENFGTPVVSIDEFKKQHKTDVVIMTAIRDYPYLMNLFKSFDIEEFYFFDVLLGDKYIEFFNRNGKFKDINCQFNKDKSYRYVNFILDHVFISPLFDMVVEQFGIEEQAFVIYRMNMTNEEDRFGIWDKYVKWSEKYNNIFLVDDIFNICNIDTYEQMRYLDDVIKKSDKVVLHSGVIDSSMSRYFEENLNVLRDKTELILWGAELYMDENDPNIHRVLNNCKTVCAAEKLYLDMATKNYGFKESQYKYVRLVYNYYEVKEKRFGENTKNILLGFGARNCLDHIQAITYIERFRGENIKVYCPFGYGRMDEHKIEEVIAYGKQCFGDKFLPIRECMPYDKYAEFLNTIDVVILPLTACAAQTTINMLMQLNKKIYMPKSEEICKQQMMTGYYIYDYEELVSVDYDDMISYEKEHHNATVVQKLRSSNDTVENWKLIYNSEE